jgi:hypothetical protein
MNFTKLKMLAGAGAIALTAVTLSQVAQAATYNNGDDVPMTATAVINNDIGVTVTRNLNFGTVGTIDDVGVGTDTATATLTPAGVFTGDLAGPAKIIDAQQADHLPAIITVSAFPATRIYVDYTAITNLTGAVTPAQIITVASITDNLNSPGTGAGGVAGGWTLTGPTFTQGYATTTAGGALVFNIGGTFRNIDGTVYTNQAFAGSFNVTLSY